MTFRAKAGAPVGVVYLVHFTEPYRHARHYTGWTADLDSGSPSTRQDVARGCYR